MRLDMLRHCFRKKFTLKYFEYFEQCYGAKQNAQCHTIGALWRHLWQCGAVGGGETCTPMVRQHMSAHNSHCTQHCDTPVPALTSVRCSCYSRVFKNKAFLTSIHVVTFTSCNVISQNIKWNVPTTRS